MIGGGPAGLTAALYLARACYRVLVIEKEKFGGQITITDEVVNYPGVMKTSGKELTQAMQKQAEHFGAEFLLGDVVSLKKAEEASGAEIWETTTDKGSYKSFGILLATGAHPRMIGFPGEAKFRGHGVAYCATCDGEFFRGKEIFVVGGGFAAAEESVFLTKYASHVTILIRGNDFSCAEAVAEAAKNHPKITVLTNTEVVYVEGDHTLRKICYKNKNTGEETIFDSADDTFGIFVFAGYAPNTDLVKDLIALDSHGYVETDSNPEDQLSGNLRSRRCMPEESPPGGNCSGRWCHSCHRAGKICRSHAGETQESTRKSQSKKRPKFTRNHPQEKNRRAILSRYFFTGYHKPAECCIFQNGGKPAT